MFVYLVLSLVKCNLDKMGQQHEERLQKNDRQEEPGPGQPSPPGEGTLVFVPFGRSRCPSRQLRDPVPQREDTGQIQGCDEERLSEAIGKAQKQAGQNQGEHQPPQDLPQDLHRDQR